MAKDRAVAVAAEAIVTHHVSYPHRGRNVGAGANHPGLNLAVCRSGLANHGNLTAWVRSRSGSPGNDPSHR